MRVHGPFHSAATESRFLSPARNSSKYTAYALIALSLCEFAFLEVFGVGGMKGVAVAICLVITSVVHLASAGTVIVLDELYLSKREMLSLFGTLMFSIGICSRSTMSFHEYVDPESINALTLMIVLVGGFLVAICSNMTRFYRVYPILENLFCTGGAMAGHMRRTELRAMTANKKRDDIINSEATTDNEDNMI